MFKAALHSAAVATFAASHNARVTGHTVRNYVAGIVHELLNLLYVAVYGEYDVYRSVWYEDVEGFVYYRSI